jgi:hypothetical protein
VDIYVDNQLKNDIFSLRQDGSTTGQLLLSTHRRFGSETDIRVDIDAVQGIQTGGTLPSTGQSVRLYNHTIRTTADRRVIDTPGHVAFRIIDDRPENADAATGQSLRILDADNNVIETAQTGVGSQIAIIDLSEYKTGVYTVITENGVETTVVIHDLELEIIPDKQTVTIGTALRGSATAAIDTPRVVTVTLVAENDTQITATPATITANGTGRFEINTTAVSNADAGIYRLLVTDPQTDLQAASDPFWLVSSVTGVGFTQTISTGARGDIIEIPLRIGTGHTATVTIGNESRDIQASVTVQDRTKDGIVTLRFNTDAAIASALDGSEETVFTLTNLSSDTQSSEENYDIIHAANLNATVPTKMDENAVPLSDDIYPMKLQSEATNRSFTSDTAMIRVEPPTTEMLQVYTAPMGTTLRTVEEITDAIDNEALTPSGVVARGDMIVYALTAEGFEGRIERDEELTIQTFDRTTTATASVDRYQTPSLSLRYTEPTSSIPNQLNNPWVVTDTPNHRYYIAATPWTPPNVVSEAQINDSTHIHLTATLQPGIRVDDIRPSHSAASDDVGMNNSASSGVGRAQTEPGGNWTVQTAVVPRQINFDADQIRVAPLSGQSITGTTTVAPGSIMTVALYANVSENQRGVTQSLNKTVTTIIGINRTWSGVFDFSAFNPGQSFMIHSMIPHSSGSVTQHRMRGRVEISPTETETATTVTAQKTGGSGGGGGGGLTGIITGLFQTDSKNINTGAQTSDASNTETRHNETTIGDRSVIDEIIAGSFTETELGRVVENTVKSSILIRLMHPVAAGFMLLLVIVSLLLYRRQ